MALIPEDTSGRCLTRFPRTKCKLKAAVHTPLMQSLFNFLWSQYMCHEMLLPPLPELDRSDGANCQISRTASDALADSTHP